MPRGRPKNIGPRLPTGGYRALTTKKRLAAKAAALATYASLPSINSAKYRKMFGISSRRGRPSKKQVVNAVASMIATAKPPRVKKPATAAQLAALAKARAIRAEKRGALMRGGQAFYDANQ